MSKTMRPYDVKDTDEFLQMESDNHPRKPGKWSILHSGRHISLIAPYGERSISIPRDQFNAIVDWYLKPQTVREPRP
ncbi:hypothetical protein [Microvirga alba]|uniref:Uncharacterized protein n=1 Tax=Microvirga alba TaxID=2791025 RepID=A0A931FPX5_9HYPH|nr:hypothetical protein [Microvirga alba]MBF9233962.1 hypothetical protein [Microvirga alba]